MVVFNGMSYLREALDSIASQTLQPCDFVAVDDGSTDGTGDLLREFGARVIRTERLGYARACDIAVPTVDGDVIACLDHDDRWRPDKLARQLSFLAAQPDIAFVGALCAMFRDPGVARPPWWKPSWDEGIPEPSLAPSATLYRRTAFERAGGFAADGIKVSEDVAWTARAHDLGLRSAVIDEILVERRIHANNTSGDQELRVREHLAIAWASIARKRSSHRDRDEGYP
jgi:glycosyltransferase involved in cell wall biosynthesis